MNVKIGINGLGRIGRAMIRVALTNDDVDIVAVNDVNPDIQNLTHLVKYDSTYGRLSEKISIKEPFINIEGRQRFRVFHEQDIDGVPWEDCGASIVIDASGVEANLVAARRLSARGVRYCVVTNSPPEDQVDRTIIIGVNHHELVRDVDFLIASSICDANAFVPVANVLEREWGIDHGFVTTLHPWLNYQNLVDGPPMSYATPGKIHTAYELGRASTPSLIPKSTSAITASCKVLNSLSGKFLSFSYRVPTMIVSSCDVSVKLLRRTSIDDVKAAFEEEEQRQTWHILFNNKEPLVSIDFKASDYSSIVDHRWLMLNRECYLKVIIWYDNEWAYASRVFDLVRFLGETDAEEDTNMQQK